MRRIFVVSMLMFLLVFLLPLIALGGAQAAVRASDSSAGADADAADLPAGDTEEDVQQLCYSPEPEPGIADSETIVRVLIGSKETEMNMHDYLCGVVAAEMPARFETEALKAQAVAARTYTLYKMRVAPSSAHEADVCDDVNCCKAYISPEEQAERWGDSYSEYSSKIAGAVAATDGVYMTYEGAPILAVFHSSSDGMTENSGDVWSMSLPYLVGVESAEDGEEIPNFYTETIVPFDEFKAIILAYDSSARLGGAPEGWFENEKLTEGGRLATIEVGGVEITGTQMRLLFSLRSTKISISVTADGVSLLTAGYGHGCGMSQYGANAMAGEGYGYTAILEHYYSGISFAGL